MSSIKFDDLKAFIANGAKKIKEKVTELFGDPYTDYDINITASHYSSPDSEPTFTTSHKGKFKIRLVDLAIAASLLTVILSFIRSIRNNIE